MVSFPQQPQEDMQTTPGKQGCNYEEWGHPPSTGIAVPPYGGILQQAKYLLVGPAITLQENLYCEFAAREKTGDRQPGYR